MINKIYFILILSFLGGQVLAQDRAAERWADSVLTSLSIEERVGQLFMERTFSKSADKDKTKALQQILKYHIGGFCFFQGDPELQKKWTDQYQKASKVPLLIAIDAEWGLGMRFKERAFSFPKQMTLGAIRDNELIYQMGQQIADHCKSIGVSVNFAPVVDVNNNPANPVIHYRSFGEDRMNVALKGYQYLLGLESRSVLGCAKHFPGHGDTDTDSHYALPVIPHDADRLDSLELFPFKVIADKDAGSMMVAHLHIPSLDSTEGLPSTLSKDIITGILREDLDYDGLVFTDAMDMKGVSDHYSAGKAAKMAFQAGNDIILLPDNLAEAHTAIMKAITDGEITIAQLNARVFRILLYKYKYALDSEYRESDYSLKSMESFLLKKKLYEKSLTLLRRESTEIPVRQIHDRSFASISFGANSMTEFQRQLTHYVEMPHYQIDYGADMTSMRHLGESLKDKDVIFVSLHDLSYSKSKDFGLSANSIAYIQELNKNHTIILTVFGTPYIMEYLPGIKNVLMAYEEDPEMEALAAQGLFGAFAMDGQLPVTASTEYPYGTGIRSPSLGRLSYGIPEEVGMSSDTLAQLEELVDELIRLKAAPGCQVLVAKDGKVVWNKAYGHHTYAKKRATQTGDIYDLASITKVAASTVSLMKLADQDRIQVSDQISSHLKRLQGTNKSKLRFNEVMSHQAGLRPWIPFYKNTMLDGKTPMPKQQWYRDHSEGVYDVQVTDNLYMNRMYQDSMWWYILDSDLGRSGRERYSDLGFYMVGETIRETTGQDLGAFAQKHFYAPLGMRTTGFKPLERFSKKAIVPSEKDDYFRMSVIHGHVHDMGSAMMGGVAGHAGLFSSAGDLVKLMQMMLNGGVYGGKEYFSDRTIKSFVSRQGKSQRKAIGWDMKELNEDRTPNMAQEASRHTFGHLGFTGTATWVDPEHQLIFIFLSNRTYPSMENTLLYKNDYRPKIQSVVYRSFLQPAKTVSLDQ